MYYNDADIQIIGYYSSELDLFGKMQAKDIITKFNESMRYKNVIKKQEKEIEQLKKVIENYEIQNER